MQELLAVSLEEMPMAEGDESTVRKLLPLSGLAYRLAVRVLGSDEGAEDVVQDAYLKAIREIRRDASTEQQRSWFLTVTANIARKRLRAAGRRKKREGSVRAEEIPVVDRELLGALRLAMNSLEEKYRLPVFLCCEEELTQREAAAVLKLPERTVSDHLRTGLGKLRKALERAGYAALPAAVLAGLKQTAPAVPASLDARLEALISGGTVETGAGAAAASTSVTAKGGIAMKLIAGIVLAGAVAAGIAVISGGKGGTPLPAEALPELKEHAENPKFKLVPIVGARGRGTKGTFYQARMGPGAGILDGPGMGADFCDTDDLDVDFDCNAYWTEAGRFNIIRKWNRENSLVTTLAGSAAGCFDGPLGRARFGGWGGGGYNSSALCVSPDGKHVFVYDNGLVRHIDLKKNFVSSVVSPLGKRGMPYPMRDTKGDVYIVDLMGGVIPPGEGYKTIRNPELEWVSGVSRWCVLDLAKGRIYAERRGPVYYWDVKTGKATWLTWHKGSKAAVRGTDTTGAMATSNFQCPVGLSISPGGRYLYMGGGDSNSFWRIDLEKKHVHIFGLLPDERDRFDFHR